MIGTAIALIVSFGLGFACGRVKNKAKLDAVHNLINTEEAKASAAAKALIGKIRSKL